MSKFNEGEGDETQAKREERAAGLMPLQVRFKDAQKSIRSDCRGLYEKLGMDPREDSEAFETTGGVAMRLLENELVKIDYPLPGANALWPNWTRLALRRKFIVAVQVVHRFDVDKAMDSRSPDDVEVAKRVVRAIRSGSTREPRGDDLIRSVDPRNWNLRLKGSEKRTRFVAIAGLVGAMHHQERGVVFATGGDSFIGFLRSTLQGRNEMTAD